MEKGAPESPAEDPSDSDRETDFHHGDEDEYEFLPTLRIRVQAGGAEIDVSAQGPDAPQVLEGLVKLALDAASKLQTNVN